MRNQRSLELAAQYCKALVIANYYRKLLESELRDFESLFNQSVEASEMKDCAMHQQITANIRSQINTVSTLLKCVGTVFKTDEWQSMIRQGASQTVKDELEHAGECNQQN